MSLSQVLLEGRKDDFLRKFRDKFTDEQKKEIFLVSRGLSPNQKFLIFLGNVISQENFKRDLDKAKEAIEKFIKYQQVLDKKDINQYGSLEDIVDAINAHENKSRRSVEELEGADVVYEDDRFTVITPKNHKTSCYYGAGTKWCTASVNSSSHFENYNVDGKLFYFIDKKAKSSDPFYKVALLQKYDGDKSYWNVKDDQFRNGWIIGTPLLDEIQNDINEYLNANYSREIEIFKDKERARLERERIRKQQQRERNARRLALMDERRENDEWNIDGDLDEMGEKANAVFDVLEQYGVNVDEEEGESIYNLVPTEYSHYDLLTFEWLGEDESGSEWAVGTWDEVYEAAKVYYEGLYEEMGPEGWNQNYVMNYIDEGEIQSYLEDLYEYDVEQNPEIYFDSEDLPLADWQEKEIEKLEEEMEELEEIVHDDDSTEEEVDDANERIEEIMSEIEEIKDSPEGEPTVGMVSDMVETLVSERMDNVMGVIEEHGLDLKEYVDMDSLISDTIDTDGVGPGLASYDGAESEAMINGTWYHVLRTN